MTVNYITTDEIQNSHETSHFTSQDLNDILQTKLADHKDGLPVMSIDEVGVDEGNVADRAALVDDRLRRGGRRRPGPRPVLVCHHFRADRSITTSENGLSNTKWNFTGQFLSSSTNF